MASLKAELFKALVDPLLREVGTRTGKVVANLVFGKEETAKVAVKQEDDKEKEEA